jgi:hypothetical protein
VIHYVVKVVDRQEVTLLDVMPPQAGWVAAVIFIDKVQPDCAVPWYLKYAVTLLIANEQLVITEKDRVVFICVDKPVGNLVTKFLPPDVILVKQPLTFVAHITLADLMNMPGATIRAKHFFHICLCLLLLYEQKACQAEA